MGTALVHLNSQIPLKSLWESAEHNTSYVHLGWNSSQNPRFGSYHGFVVTVFGSVGYTLIVRKINYVLYSRVKTERMGQSDS